MLSLWTQLEKSWPHKGFFLESFGFHEINLKKKKKSWATFWGLVVSQNCCSVPRMMSQKPVSKYPLTLVWRWIQTGIKSMAIEIFLLPFFLLEEEDLPSSNVPSTSHLFSPFPYFWTLSLHFILSILLFLSVLLEVCSFCVRFQVQEAIYIPCVNT